jgi:hypothetical protein
MRYEIQSPISSSVPPIFIILFFPAIIRVSLTALRNGHNISASAWYAKQGATTEALPAAAQKEVRGARTLAWFVQMNFSGFL